MERYYDAETVRNVSVVCFIPDCGAVYIYRLLPTFRQNLLLDFPDERLLYFKMVVTLRLLIRLPVT